MDFKNQGEPKVLKDEDPRAWFPTDLENDGIFVGRYVASLWGWIKCHFKIVTP